MNMNMNLVNRALLATGQEMLTQQDRDEKTEVYQLCKAFYLATYLEALSEVTWTSAKRRRRLLMTRLPHNRTEYRFVYDLPFDCARPVELLNKSFFVIEGSFLCTDEERAELLYITNGKRLPEIRALTAPKPGGIPLLVLSSGFAREFTIPDDVTFFPGSIKDLPKTEPAVPEEDPQWTEDYPWYQETDIEPKFFEYMEKTLAAKLAFKLSSQPNLHLTLLQEAQLIKNDAITTSKSASAAKQQPRKWWTDELGIGK